MSPELMVERNKLVDLLFSLNDEIGSVIRKSERMYQFLKGPWWTNWKEMFVPAETRIGEYVQGPEKVRS